MLHSIVYAIIGSFIGLSQSAGIGGGPILNICLMIGLEYSARSAMAITYIFLMGGSLASIMRNVVKRKKNGNLLMDYNLILMTMPMATSGSIFGTMLNHYLSQFIVTICFTILLSYLIYVSYNQYKTFNSSSANQANTSHQILVQREQESQMSMSNLHPALVITIQKNRQVFQKDKFKMASYIILYTVVILLVRGAQSYDSWIGLEPCEFGFWACNVLHLALSYLVAKSVAIQQFKIQYEQSKLGLDVPEEDKITESKMRFSMFYGFVSGLFGGTLGLGGAIILVPVWLSVGIDKDVAASSSGPLIFVSSFCSFFITSLSGMYQLKEFVSFMFLSFFSSLFVKQFIDWIAMKYGLKSMAYILLGITMCLSLFTLLPFQIAKYGTDPQQFMQFGEFC